MNRSLFDTIYIAVSLYLIQGTQFISKIISCHKALPNCSYIPGRQVFSKQCPRVGWKKEGLQRNVVLFWCFDGWSLKTRGLIFRTTCNEVDTAFWHRTMFMWSKTSRIGFMGFLLVLMCTTNEKGSDLNWLIMFQNTLQKFEKRLHPRIINS